MTVMCRLVCGKTYHRTAKLLFNYVIQRSKNDMLDSVISLCSAPITSQSVSGKDERNKLVTKHFSSLNYNVVFHEVKSENLLRPFSWSRGTCCLTSTIRYP